MNVKYLYTFLLTIIIFSSLLRLIGAVFALIIAACCTIIISISVIKGKKFFIQNKFLIIVFSAYIVCSLIAALIHNDNRMFENSVFSVFVFFTISLIFNSSLKEDAINIAFRATIYAYIPFMILCFIYNPNYLEPFKGIFTNSNAMGLAMLGLFVMLLTKIYSVLYRNIVSKEPIKLLSLLFYVVLYCIGLYIVFISNSRASLLAIIVGTLIMIMVLLFKMRKNLKSSIKGISLISMLLMIIIFGVLRIPVLNEALNSILFKFELKSNSDRLTSGRVDIWQMVLDNIALWGHGNQAFSKLGISHAHNIFLDILQETGIFSLVFYLVFILSLLFLGVRVIINNSFEPEGIIIILACVVYIIAGMVEAFDYHILIFYVFLSSGFLNTRILKSGNLIIK